MLNYSVILINYFQYIMWSLSIILCIWGIKFYRNFRFIREYICEKECWYASFTLHIWLPNYVFVYNDTTNTIYTPLLYSSWYAHYFERSVSLLFIILYNFQTGNFFIYHMLLTVKRETYSSIIIKVDFL